MGQAKNDRLYRLAGDGNSGGGLPLPPLFVTILERLLDGGPADESKLTELVAARIGKRDRCAVLYGPDDPWGGLTRDALAQLADRHLIERSGMGWQLGEAFQPDKPLTVIRARKGKNEACAVTVYAPERRAGLAANEVQRMEIASLAARLQPDGPGLRTPPLKHVAALADSMRAFGWQTAHPILVDQHGRILDGRCRLAAAEQADVRPTYRRVDVQDDREALSIAWTANETSGWTRQDRERVARLLQANGITVADFGRVLSRAGVRVLVEQALQEDAQRSDRSIAEQVGCSHPTVTAVRRELEETGKIYQFRATGGRGVRSAPPARSSNPTPRPPSIPQQELDARLERATEERASNRDVRREVRSDGWGVRDERIEDGLREKRRNRVWDAYMALTPDDRQWFLDRAGLMYQQAQQEV